ncbi:chloride channel protein [Labrys okinawensis]|uniref:chloride channel protein n=1 Tax=Labrys okinawensis TaxID=346911 RepID=UPI0039BC88FA
MARSNDKESDLRSGVTAASNTPLAAIAFAIEESASSWQQRLASLTTVAVMIPGLVDFGDAGD